MNFKEIIVGTKNLFIKHQPFILFSVVVLILPILLSYIPYVNLVYTIDKGMFIYLLMVLIFVRPSEKFLLILGIILLLSALIFLLFGFAVLAEHIGNIIFLLIAVRIIYIIFVHFTRSKND